MVDSNAVEIPVEESAVEAEEEFFAAQPEEEEQEVAVTLEVEGAVEIGQPAAAAEAADERALIDDAPAEGAYSPERLPGEQSEEQPPEEIVGESISSEDTSVAPLPPSEPLTELADATPSLTETQTPGPTLVAKAVTPDQEEVDETAIAEEAAPGVSESEVMAATSVISELAPTEPVPVDSGYPGPGRELAFESDQIEEQTAVQRVGIDEGISTLTLIEIVLGIGLLTLIAATILLRRRVR
jgi:hypothetical protein